MRTSSTVGFAVDETDRARLDHLADVFGGGNRSAFLRKAIDIMEELELVQEIGRLQAFGAQRLAEAGYTIEDIPEIVDKALADPDPEALAQAKLIVAGMTRTWPSPICVASPDDERRRVAFYEALDEIRSV
ncbi:MAG: hypothetical protein ACYDEP_12320 [Acidimicrobiales bacterium]|jgi:hypothetical protein